ncbi:MAG: hypothetical protein M3Y49_14800 [Actinomycetota bacterium]|nr:hypothetical protein [Actinomycetota bacterium]
MGRRSKGTRALLGCRAPEKLDKAVRIAAADHGMSISDYMVTVLALHLGMPDQAPLQDSPPDRLPMTG